MRLEQPQTLIFVEIIMALVIGVASFNLLTSKAEFPSGDDLENYWLIRSFIEDGDANLKNQFTENSINPVDQCALGIDGEWYPVHELLLAIVSVPVFAAFGFSGLVVMVLLIYYMALLVIYRLSTELNGRVPAVMAVCVALLSHSRIPALSNDTFGALLALIAFYLLHNQKMLKAGAVFSVLLFARLPLMVLGLPFLLVIISGHLFLNSTRSFLDLLIQGIKDCGLFLLGTIPISIFYLITNASMFGNPFLTSYSRWIKVTGSVPEVLNQSGILFSLPITQGVLRLLVGFPDGFFFLQPAFALAVLFGFPLLLRRAPKIFVFIISSHLVLLLLYAGYPGAKFNPIRYFELLEWLYIIPLALVLERILPKKWNKLSEAYTSSFSKEL